MNKLSVTFELSKDWNILFSSEGPASHFFGYYCHYPLSSNGRFLLAHRTPYDARDLVKGDSAEIGYFSLPEGEWTKVGETKAFNWQDGSMLQWIPGSVEEIVYNVLGDDGYPAAIRTDLNNTKRVLLEKPVYTLHPSGDWALGVNVSRIAECRPSYGYRDSTQESKRWKGSLPEGDGLFRIDLSSGKSSLLLETAKLVAEADFQFPEGAWHFIQNPIWNPSGTRFVALHRYMTGSSFRSRLFTADYKGEKIRVYPDAALYSHAKWRNDEEFVIWSNPGKSLTSRYLTRSGPKSLFLNLIRWGLTPLSRIVKGNPRSRQRLLGYGYFLFNDRIGKSRPLAHGSITIDGHPGFACEGRLMVTDTYQDEELYRHLIAYDLQTDKAEKIAKFVSPFNNCGYRCDLHPRTSGDGSIVSFDSAHTERRQIYLMART